MELLSGRQENILNCVVETYIDTIQPVGSRFVRERYSLSTSAATVRYEMGALEGMGYLSHTHTSSGRIPTDSGYRYYIDHGLSQESFPESLFSSVEERLYSIYRQNEVAELFMEQVLLMLSSLTGEVGLTIFTKPSSDTFNQSERSKLFLQGLPHILEKPEFQDVKKAHSIIKNLEEKTVLKEWVTRNTKEDDVSVSIGEESEDDVFRDCAIVTARYSAKEKMSGVISVFGPKRMRYARIIPLVSKMATTVEKMVEKMDTGRLL